MMIKKAKPLIILMGKSGVGKTSVARYLCETYGWSQIESYTTRPRRSADEIGHHFISDAEFDQIPEDDRIAYMEYCGYRYCSRREQLDSANLYVVTPDGYDRIKEEYCGRPLFTIALVASEDVLKSRMRMRGGSTEEQINERTQRDDAIFRNLKSDVTIPTDHLSISEVGDAIITLTGLLSLPDEKGSTAADQLPDEELLTMCNEIFIWKNGTGVMPADSHLKLFAAMKQMNIRIAEELVLNAASERFQKLVVLLMTERPYKFLNYRMPTHTESK